MNPEPGCGTGILPVLWRKQAGRLTDRQDACPTAESWLWTQVFHARSFT